MLKHIILSRMFFNNKKLLNSYLKITKEILIPSLKKQTNQNFIWGVVINPEHIDYVRDFVDYDFISFSNHSEYFKYVVDKKITIQTRHDMDDYMSNDYVEKIQETYNKNRNAFDIFLIHSQPVRFDYNTKKNISMKEYNDKRVSMFLSLCQKNVSVSVFKEKHGQMYKVTNNIIKLPEGYTKWVIHGNNKSVLNKSIKYGKN
jgi:hypothetical protein